MTKQSHCIAGSITAGCFSTLLGHPLDTIKVHQQTNPRLSNGSSLLDVARLLARGDPSRLFRGMGPPMANQILMNSVMFTVFDVVKDAVAKNCSGGTGTISGENSSAMVAGLFSGFATACLSTPADWIKIQAQISLSNDDNGGGIGKRRSTTTSSRHDVASILRHGVMRDGIFPFFTQTLYRGHVANLGREGVFTMVYLGLYDRISAAVKARRRHDDGNNGIYGDHDQTLGTGTVVAISSSTGACAWMCNYPFDTVKTVMQAGPSSKRCERVTLRQAIRSIYNSGGWKAFWRGAGSSTLRAMLVTSSRMLAYEKTIQMLR